MKKEKNTKNTPNPKLSTPNPSPCSMFHVPCSMKGGFTLVETLVAVTILTLAVTGPMVIAQKGISAAIYSRDQITAFYLAQEAMEYISYVKDSNKLATNADWLTYLNPCLNPATCRVDARISDPSGLGAIGSCSGSGNDSGSCTLTFNNSTKLYGYGGSTYSRFTRSISIDEIVNGVDNQEAVVTVTISWTTNIFPLGNRTFTVKKHIFNYSL